jgi:hypothetical protein
VGEAASRRRAGSVVGGAIAAHWCRGGSAAVAAAIVAARLVDVARTSHCGIQPPGKRLQTTVARVCHASPTRTGSKSHPEWNSVTRLYVPEVYK